MLPLSLGKTPRALTAFGSDVLVKVSLTVVDGDLLARFDVAFGVNPNLVFNRIAFCVRAARMIEITRQIVARTSVNRAFFIKLEQVFIGAAVGFIGGNNLALVFEYACAALDGLGCE